MFLKIYTNIELKIILCLIFNTFLKKLYNRKKLIKHELRLFVTYHFFQFYLYELRFLILFLNALKNLLLIKPKRLNL